MLNTLIYTMVKKKAGGLFTGQLSVTLRFLLIDTANYGFKGR